MGDCTRIQDGSDNTSVYPPPPLFGFTITFNSFKFSRDNPQIAIIN